MIAYSLFVLAAFLGCIIVPFVLVAPADQEYDYKTDLGSEDKTDTFFLRG